LIQYDGSVHDSLRRSRSQVHAFASDR
jgi:hypothetical protein